MFRRQSILQSANKPVVGNSPGKPHRSPPRRLGTSERDSDRARRYRLISVAVAARRRDAASPAVAVVALHDVGRPSFNALGTGADGPKKWWVPPGTKHRACLARRFPQYPPNLYQLLDAIGARRLAGDAQLTAFQRFRIRALKPRRTQPRELAPEVRQRLFGERRIGAARIRRASVGIGWACHLVFALSSPTVYRRRARRATGFCMVRFLLDCKKAVMP
jgi:hypothetical protein